jgi:hypothetical protein
MMKRDAVDRVLSWRGVTSKVAGDAPGGRRTSMATASPARRAARSPTGKMETTARGEEDGGLPAWSRHPAPAMKKRKRYKKVRRVRVMGIFFTVDPAFPSGMAGSVSRAGWLQDVP